MTKLVTVANLWTLNRHPRPGRPWSLERKIAAVAEAGFDGLMAALTPEHARLAERHGVAHRIGFVVAKDLSADFGALLRAQKDAGAVRVNVHLGGHDTPPRMAADQWARLVDAAERIGGLEVSLETHRDTCTETPEKTYELAARHRKSTGAWPRFTLDFSHWAVVKHLQAGNYLERLLDRPELLAGAEQIHFRPFNGHHCQVPVTWRGRLTTEAETYFAFARTVMTRWRDARRDDERTLFACPEMGPDLEDGSGYAITGFPPAWTDAVRLRTELLKLWRRAGAGPGGLRPSARTVRG